VTSGESTSFAGTQRFEITARLGAGGMGVVYAARDRQRNAPVALKTLRHVDAQSIYRFKQEFRALADLEHENLIRLGELFCEEGQWFFTMELVEGVDFLQHVRDPSPQAASSADTLPRVSSIVPRANEARLRAALRQLAAGVATLHAARRLHRDIKPTNILVTPQGRVVLLDFGLAAHLSELKDADLGGTLCYMAPEQSSSHGVGPEADWYSVGSLLYEALAGQPPFQGTPLEILDHKKEHEPPAPSQLRDDVPGDLDLLCRELLRIDPRARPRPEEILERLGVEAQGERGLLRAATHSLSGTSSFVGRAVELDLLRSAFTQSLDEPTLVFVHGESGVGKSSLVRHFAESLELERRDVLALFGRCHESESVPYKALDGLLDALSRFLTQEDQIDVALLLCEDVAALARLFPALRRSAAVARLPELQLSDPVELRSRAFVGLKRLLCAIAVRRRVLLCIDDLQWTDADSMALLADLVNPPDAPPILLLCTVQSGVDNPALEPTGRLGQVRDLHLEGLAPKDSEELLERLLGQAGTGRVAEIAREAAGHPLFLHELALQSGDLLGDLRLDEVLWRRVLGMGHAARSMVELLAVAGAPVPQAVLGAATGLDAAGFDRELSVLRVARLARSMGRRATDTVDLYHNRIRKAVVGMLPAKIQAHYHARLAEALKTEGEGHSLALVRHLEGGGQLRAAANHASMAALVAVKALAFGTGAELYRTALRLGQFTETDAQDLRLRLADALANAGQSAQAAEVYRDALASARGDDTLELSRRMAEQLLISGRIDEGLGAMRQVFATVGEPFPSGPYATLLALALLRLRLRLTGRRFVRRDALQVPVATLHRIDVCWSASLGLAPTDFIRGTLSGTRHLLLALKAGEPMRVARGLAGEAILVASAGARNSSRAAALLAKAGRLTDEVDSPYLRGFLRTAGGFVALFEGRWKDARELFARAIEVLRMEKGGVAWELRSARQSLAPSLYQLGRVREHGQHVFQCLREATARGDLQDATTWRSGINIVAWLAKDDVQGAMQALRESSQYSERARVHRVWLLLEGQTMAELYQGHAQEAWDRMRAGWPDFQRSLLSRMQLARARTRWLHATAAVAAARALGGSERAALLATATRDAKLLGRERVPWTDALATLARAGIGAAQGVSSASETYALAARQFERADMSLFAAVARWRADELRGRPSRWVTGPSADPYFGQQGIREPARLVGMLAP
jgi:serine/threonine protein kinase